MAKTILICCNAYPPAFIGGAELIAHYQAQALHRLGHRVLIFTGDIRDVGQRHQVRYEPFEGLDVYRVRVTDLDFRADMVNFYHPAIEREFAGILERYRPDVVHCHNLAGLSTGILSQARKAEARTAVTLHDHWGFCYRNTIIRHEGDICDDFLGCHDCQASIGDGADRNIPIRLRNDFIAAQLEACDVLISPSNYLARQYTRAGFPVNRIRVVWNGIDIERFGAVRKQPRVDTVRFTFIGYLGPHKGVGTLIRAIEILAARTRRFVVNIVGVGELEELLATKFSSGELAGNVRLLGRVPNAMIDRVFGETDVQLLPSIWPENQPVSITEAMASRTAVIASSLGGTPELVEHGRSGFLVPAGGAEALADAMTQFINNPRLIDEFGARGHERMKEFSFDRQVRTLLHLYDAPPEPARSVEVQCLNEAQFSESRVREINDFIPRFNRTTTPLRLILPEWISTAPERKAGTPT